VCARMCVCVCVRARVCTYVFVYLYIIYIILRVHTCIHTYRIKVTGRNIHTYIHTYTHIHTYIQKLAYSSSWFDIKVTGRNMFSSLAEARFKYSNKTQCRFGSKSESEFSFLGGDGRLLKIEASEVCACVCACACVFVFLP
jgi:hypothetical protein